MSKHVVHELFLCKKNYPLLNINSINTCFKVVQVLFHFFLISCGNVFNIKISTTKLPLRHVPPFFFQCYICSSYRISYGDLFSSDGTDISVSSPTIGSGPVGSRTAL